MKQTRMVVLVTGIACALSAAVLCPSARAQSLQIPAERTWYSGFYLSASVGTSSRAKTVENGGNQFTSWKTGQSYLGALGYHVNDRFRMEVERLGLRSPVDMNQADVVTFGAFNPQAVPGSGRATLGGWMLNGTYDIPIRGARFAPYVGLGIGTWRSYLSQLTSPELARIGQAVAGTPLVLSTQSRNHFGYQAMVGIGYRLSPGLETFVNARYFYGGVYWLQFDQYGFGQKVPQPRVTSIEFGTRLHF